MLFAVKSKQMTPSHKKPFLPLWEVERVMWLPSERSLTLLTTFAKCG